MHFLPLFTGIRHLPHVLIIPPTKACPLCATLRRLVECCFTSTETVGLLGTGAQNGHLDFHTALELCATPAGMDLYVQVHVRKHLPSAVTWISEDRLLSRCVARPSWSVGTMSVAEIYSLVSLNCLVSLFSAASVPFRCLCRFF